MKHNLFIRALIMIRSLALRLLRFFVFLYEFFVFSSKQTKRFSLRLADLAPCLDDRTPTTGIDRHYLFHISWAIRTVKRINPVKHVDISSSLYFSAALSAFTPVDFYDYRPIDFALSDLHGFRADLCKLPFADGSIASLSCMHVIEHIGLGRYGDPLDPDGDLTAIAELKRVLAPGGYLLLVVPIGKNPRIMFNANRVYTVNQIKTYCHDLALIEFALISDNKNDPPWIIDPTPEKLNEQQYGCGCFLFRKTN
jgi:SAM-dependent methyltransferase